MKYYISTVFLRTRDVIEIATAANELGYHGLAIADHVVNMEQLSSRYPYTDDGRRRWQPFTEWPDPWVMIGALAQAAPRLRFVTTVYIAAMRTTWPPKPLEPRRYCPEDGLNLASASGGAKRSSRSWVKGSTGGCAH